MESYKDVEGLTKELHKAVISLSLERARKILDDGAFPSLLVSNTTALHLVVRKPKNLEEEKKALAILEVLLDKGGNINQLAAYRTVMNLAGHNSFWQAVLLIAKKKKSGARDGGQYGSALLDAVRFCDQDELLQNLVLTLLEGGAIPNLHNKYDGYTALHWAVLKEKPFVLQMLLAGFPEACLVKSVATDLHGKARTPARMAYKLFVKYEQKSHLSADEQEAKKRLWQCICVIAEAAYLPIIEGENEKYPEQLVREKDIIRRYVFSLLPMERRWRAILDGQDEWHPLGRLNNTQRIIGVFDTTTMGIYKTEEVKMREQGYPDILIKKQSTLPQYSILRTSPQMFQSAPRIIPDYVSAGLDRPSVSAYSPIFQFSPPSSSEFTPQHSSPISIKPPSTSGSATLYPARHRSRSSSPSTSTSTSPRDVLAELFGSSAIHSHEGSPLKGPSRFGPQS